MEKSNPSAHTNPDTLRPWGVHLFSFPKDPRKLQVERTTCSRKSPLTTLYPHLIIPHPVDSGPLVLSSGDYLHLGTPASKTAWKEVELEGIGIIWEDIAIRSLGPGKGGFKK